MKEKEKTKRVIDGCIEIEKNEKGFVSLYINTKKYGRLGVHLNDYTNPKRVKTNRKLKYRMYMEAI